VITAPWFRLARSAGQSLVCGGGQGGADPPAVRFSGVADVQVGVVADAWTAADVCPWMAAVAVVAVTGAVS